VVTFTLHFSITWPNNQHPQKFVANELPITSELGKTKISLTWPCQRVVVQMIAVEIKKQKNTPKVEEKQQDILG
jgi:hypothetical protein